MAEIMHESYSQLPTNTMQLACGLQTQMGVLILC